MSCLDIASQVERRGFRREDVHKTVPILPNGAPVDIGAFRHGRDRQDLPLLRRNLLVCNTYFSLIRVLRGKLVRKYLRFGGQDILRLKRKWHLLHLDCVSM